MQQQQQTPNQNSQNNLKTRPENRQFYYHDSILPKFKETYAVNTRLMRHTVLTKNYFGVSLKQTKCVLSKMVKISKDIKKVINVECSLCNQ